MDRATRTGGRTGGLKKPGLAICADDLSMLLEKIYQKIGADFRNYKKASIARRVVKRLGAHNCASVREYLEILDKDPGEYDRLVSTLTIKVSEFFRDPEVFKAVRSAVSGVPGASRGVRAWSCGCASGEEAYSVAIVLSEVLSAEALRNTVVFATDIDSDAIERARIAEYREDSLVNADAECRAKHLFMSSNVFWKVNYAIRNIVRFGVLDLVKGHPISRVQILFCRNVFIYFNKELQAEVFRKLDFAIRPGGLLVLGTAEQVPSEWSHLYRPVCRDLNVFQKSA